MALHGTLLQFSSRCCMPLPITNQLKTLQDRKGHRATTVNNPVCVRIGFRCSMAAPVKSEASRLALNIKPPLPFLYNQRTYTHRNCLGGANGFTMGRLRVNVDAPETARHGDNQSAINQCKSNIKIHLLPPAAPLISRARDANQSRAHTRTHTPSHAGTPNRSTFSIEELHERTLNGRVGNIRVC